MPLIYDDERSLPKQRVCIYGDPATGKTPLVMQLPWGSEYYGEAIYWAADDGSETLRSCPPELRKYLHVVKGSKGPDGKYDPKRESWEIIMTDWRKKWPGVKTIIVDTMTEVGQEILANIANSNAFSDRHITIGDPGGAYTHNIPMPGDYGASQDEVGFMLKELLKSDLHVFVLFHTAIDESNNGTVIAGGPATVGKATIRKVAKPFDAKLRVEKKQVFNADTKQAAQCIVVHSEASGIWIGGVRDNKETNPIPEVAIPMGKKLALYWPLYHKHFYPEVTEEMLKVREPVAAPVNGAVAAA